MKKTINIPDGYKINWEESKKANKVIIEPTGLTYKDVCEKLFTNNIYFISNHGSVSISGANNAKTNANNSTTEFQLQVLLAKNKLANVAKYLNNGWKPNDNDKVYYIYVNDGVHVTGGFKYNIFDCILFKSYDLALQAIDILGEKQIKLALSNLY